MTLTSSAPAVQLHALDPQAILPLLAEYLPHSLTVYASIQCGPIPSPPEECEPLTEPWRYAWATITPDEVEERQSDGRHATGDDPDFVVIVQMVGAMRHQTRMFCSAECPRPGESAAERLNRRKRGSSLVKGAVERYLQITRTVTVLGAVHEYWIRELYQALDMEYTERLTDLWLEPAGDDDDKGRPRKIRGDEDGQRYLVDEANEDDCRLVRDHRGIKEDIAYYLERRQHTTVIRYRPGPTENKEDQAVAWIITHAAGDQGALHVDPEHRRRGLAKWVALANLERERKAGRAVRGHVWVTRGNEASEALWKAMGWEQAWTVQWIHLGPNSY